MLASQLRVVAQKVRHAPGLRSINGLWDSVRPLYTRVLDKLSQDNGVEVRIAGCSVRLSPRFSATAWESVECDSYELFVNVIRPGDIIYDVGAHIGTYSVLALQKSAPTGRVIAYEPVGLTREFLLRHVSWNGGTDRVLVRPCSCGSATAEAPFYFRKGEMNGDSGLLAAVGTDVMSVQVRTLDSEVDELQLVPTIIKIDVEGWEFEVLQGAEAILIRYHPILFVSLHPRALQNLGLSSDYVKNWLQERGYACRVIGVDHEIHLLATPTEAQNER